MFSCLNCQDLTCNELDCDHTNWDTQKGYYNAILRPDMATLRYSYMPNEAVVLCDYFEPFISKPMRFDPRHILKNQILIAE